MLNLIDTYSKKIKTLLKSFNTNGFAPSFTCGEFILGTQNLFLNQIDSDSESEEALERDLKLLYEGFERELSQSVIDNLCNLSWALQFVRDKIDVPMYITCAFRPKVWELHKGRSGESMHVKGIAADFTCEKLQEAYQFIRDFFALGGRHLYIDMSFIHFDIRRKLATW